MYTCIKCRIVFPEEQIGAVGNGAHYCTKCAEECGKEEMKMTSSYLNEHRTMPGRYMRRYISMVTWGIDPA